jgi:hypothetical protein
MGGNILMHFRAWSFDIGLGAREQKDNLPFLLILHSLSTDFDFKFSVL